MPADWTFRSRPRQIPPRGAAMSFDQCKDVVEFGKWADVERRFGS
jgi:hypothetical protein